MRLLSHIASWERHGSNVLSNYSRHVCTCEQYLRTNTWQTISGHSESERSRTKLTNVAEHHVNNRNVLYFQKHLLGVAHPQSVNLLCSRSHRRHYHSISCSNVDPVCSGHNVFTQTRTFSRETYNNWFSPDLTPFAYAQRLLEWVHTYTGLPWWASIMLTTFALRSFVTLPFAIYSQYILARVELLQPEIKQLAKELSIETARAVKQFNWSEKKARARFDFSMKRLVRELYIRDNCHPFKISVVAWIQLPLWISMSIALRNMSGGWVVANERTEVLCPNLQTEGLLWFSDLTMTDSTLILPVLLTVLNLTIIEIQTLRPGERTKLQRYITNALRGLSLLMIPIGSIVPSSMCWYWFCSSAVGLSQNVMMKLPSIRRLIRLPALPSDSHTPFKDMMSVAKTRYRVKSRQDRT